MPAGILVRIAVAKTLVGTYHREFVVFQAGPFGGGPSGYLVEGIPVTADISTQTDVRTPTHISFTEPGNTRQIVIMNQDHIAVRRTLRNALGKFIYTK